MYKKILYFSMFVLVFSLLINPVSASARRYYQLFFNHQGYTAEVENQALVDYERSIIRNRTTVERKELVRDGNFQNHLPFNAEAKEETEKEKQEAKDTQLKEKTVAKTEIKEVADVKELKPLKKEVLVIETKPEKKRIVAQLTFSNTEKEAFEQINQYRRNNGLNDLQWSDDIATVAREHSTNMSQGKVPFSHNGFDGRYAEIKAFMKVIKIGENVAYNYGYKDPVTLAVEGWIKSPGHLANIKGDYSKTGVGIAISSEGKYYLTQIFIK